MAYTVYSKSKYSRKWTQHFTDGKKTLCDMDLGVGSGMLEDKGYAKSSMCPRCMDALRARTSSKADEL